MFGITVGKSRSQLVRQELGQSVEHFKQAANDAAAGTGTTVGQQFYAARDRVQPAAGRVKDVASDRWETALATLAPLAVAAGDAARKTGDSARKTSESARKSGKDVRKAKNKNMKKLQKRTNKALNRKQGGSKAGKLAGLLVGGVAIGAVAAYVLKRRQREQWDEYDPSRPINPADQVVTGVDDAAFEPVEPAGTAAFTPSTPITPAPTVTTITPATTVYGESTDEVVPSGDQTSSKKHTPEVARQASGTTKS